MPPKLNTPKLPYLFDKFEFVVAEHDRAAVDLLAILFVHRVGSRFRGENAAEAVHAKAVQEIRVEFARCHLLETKTSPTLSAVGFVKSKLTQN